MIERSLRQQLDGVARRMGRQRLLWRVSLCWLAGAACAAAVLGIGLRFDVFRSPVPAAIVIAVLTAALAGVICARTLRSRPDPLSAARAVEGTYPDLNDRLLAAAEQRPDAGSGRLNYLQRAVVDDVLWHSRLHDWRTVVPARRMLAAGIVQCVCLGAFIAVSVVLLRHDASATTASDVPVTSSATRQLEEYGLAVEPGDAEIERGTSLLVLARFEGKLPGGARVLVAEPNTSPRSLELTRSLDDPLFGGRIPDVQSDLAYHVQYDGHRSPEFRVNVFDFPKLERADITVTAPPYASREPVTVSDARRVSMLEGSQVTLVCHVNKPLAAAELQAAAGEAAVLQPVGADEMVWSVTFTPAASGRYLLLLTDHEARANKLPAEFVIDVIPNRPPELKLTFPGKDVRVSPLEELSLEATAWDDVGLLGYGVVCSHDGREFTIVLGDGASRQQDAALAHQLALEELEAEPDQLVSYYFFADDHAADGTIRRTASDMFFAEVRPFEEIYREGQQPPGGGGPPSGGGPQGQKIEQLAELQKQIVSATWTLIRREASPAGRDSLATDVDAVVESQEAAITQLDELREKLNDARSQRFASDAEEHMQRVVERLHEARGTDGQSVLPAGGRIGNPSYAPLGEALAAEQAAYQALLRLRAREHEVVRGGGGGGGGGGGSPSQQQLNQLELTSKENRYQTEQRAQSQPPSANREELQVLNRLRELARRQSGVNQQLKELELALQNARTDQDREELERRLKRLRDEQQQVLRDLDELRDRMDRPENARQMSESRQQVDQTREQVRQASDALREGQVSQAISSGTRAERELDDLREDFRQRTAHQFDDAMNDLREQARDLSERQQRLGESLEELDTDSRRSLRDAQDRREVSRELSGQKDRLAEMLDRMRRVTEEAEASEPLLSKQLYDAARQARTDAPEKSLDAASQLTDRGLLSDARSAADQARRGIDSLRAGVERAADAVLGNELDSLKRARDDVRELARELDRELAQAEGAQAATGAGDPPRTADASQTGSAGPQPRSHQDGQPSGRGQESSSSNKPQSPGSPSDASPPGGSGQPADTPTSDQPTSDQNQPPSGSASPASAAAAGRNPSSSGSPMGEGGPSAGQGEAGQTAPGGQEGNSPARGPGREQRPSLLSNGGQSGGPGDGPGGRAGAAGGAGPLTGGEFQQWSDRLRDVEETVDDPDLRNDVSRIRERARSVRAQFKRHAEEPNWDLVQAEILEPLLELEDRLANEIVRQESPDALVPIDRDPVPTRFAEAVREYYERLGDGRR